MEIQISELNIITLCIVVIVGAMGIISLINHDDITATACVSGLLGYMGRYYQSKANTLYTGETPLEEDVKQ